MERVDAYFCAVGVLEGHVARARRVVPDKDRPETRHCARVSKTAHSFCDIGSSRPPSSPARPHPRPPSSPPALIPRPPASSPARPHPRPPSSPARPHPPPAPPARPYRPPGPFARPVRAPWAPVASHENLPEIIPLPPLTPAANHAYTLHVVSHFFIAAGVTFRLKGATSPADSPPGRMASAGCRERAACRCRSSAQIENFIVNVPGILIWFFGSVTSELSVSAASLPPRQIRMVASAPKRFLRTGPTGPIREIR